MERFCHSQFWTSGAQKKKNNCRIYSQDLQLATTLLVPCGILARSQISQFVIHNLMRAHCITNISHFRIRYYADNQLLATCERHFTGCCILNHSASYVPLKVKYGVRRTAYTELKQTSEFTCVRYTFSHITEGFLRSFHIESEKEGKTIFRRPE